MQYYSNYVATYRIILPGDIGINPGPALRKQKCQVCDKTVRCNQKRLICEQCLEMCHIKCSNHQRNQSASKERMNGPARIVYILLFHSKQNKFRF